MTELPPHMDAITGVDRSTVESIRQQLDLAQQTYDPNGVFCQHRSSDWAFTIVRDTTTIAELPPIYQTGNTRLTATARSHHTKEQPFVVADIQAGTFSDTFSTRDHSHIPMVQLLLNGIAHINMEDFKYNPQSVLPFLEQLPPSQRTFLQRRLVQKTYDPQRTEVDAIHLTLSEMSGSTMPQGYSLNFGRPVNIDGTPYVYWQYITCDDPGLPAFYHHRSAFTYDRPFRLGAQYQTGTEAIEVPSIGVNQSDILGLRGLESYLELRNNKLVGALNSTDLNRLLTEPLDESLRLR